MRALAQRTDTVRAAILEAFSLGASFRVAAATGGWSPAGLAKWVEDDETLAQEIELAQADFVLENLRGLREAAPKSWQARAWLLERARPDEYGRTIQQHQVDVKAQVQQQIEVVFVDNWRGNIREQGQLMVESEARPDGDAASEEQAL
jgi:hypothetical protein